MVFRLKADSYSFLMSACPFNIMVQVADHETAGAATNTICCGPGTVLFVGQWHLLAVLPCWWCW